MRLPGVNRKQNDLQNQFNCNCTKKYKKQDAVKISAEIKRRENVNSNSLICDMPANEQAVAQKFIGDSFMMGAQVAQTAQDPTFVRLENR